MAAAIAERPPDAQPGTERPGGEEGRWPELENAVFALEADHTHLYPDVALNVRPFRLSVTCVPAATMLVDVKDAGIVVGSSLLWYWV